MGCCDCQDCPCPNPVQFQTGTSWKKDCDKPTVEECCYCASCPSEKPHYDWNPYNLEFQAFEDRCECICDPEQAGKKGYWEYTEQKNNKGVLQKTGRTWIDEGCPANIPDMDGTRCQCVCKIKINPSLCPPESKPTEDPNKCECVCSLTAEECIKRDPSKPFVSEECKCYCNKSAATCPKSNPKFNDSNCSCYCDLIDGQGNHMCSGETPLFDAGNCKCYCDKLPIDCKEGEVLKDCECVPCDNKCPGCQKLDKDCNCVGCEDCNKTEYTLADGVTKICCKNADPKNIFNPGETPCGDKCYNKDCPFGQYFEEQVCACLCKDKDAVLCNGKCLSCKSPKVPDLANCRCVDGCEDTECLGCKFPIKKADGTCECYGCADCSTKPLPDGQGGVICCERGRVFCGGNCLLPCPAGRVMDQNCNCSCPEGTELCGGKCVPRCTGGKIRMPEPNCDCRCDPSIRPRLELCKGQCRRPCLPGQIRDDECNCRCPEGERLCEDEQGKRCIPICPSINHRLKGCECVCQEGLEACGDKCYQRCAFDSPRDQQTCKCLCPEGFSACDDDLNGRCIKCKEDEVFNPVYCDCGCAPGEARCEATGKCIPECPFGKVFDNECKCVCAPRTYLCDNGFCHSAVCPEGEKFNSKECRCTCIVGEPGCCQSNSGLPVVLCNGECYNPTCPDDGMVFDYAICKCTCGRGQERCNGLCVDGKCKEQGKIRNPKTCQCCTPGEEGCCEEGQIECRGYCAGPCGELEVLHEYDCECVCDNTKADIIDGECIRRCAEGMVRCQKECYAPCPEGLARRESDCQCIEVGTTPTPTPTETEYIQALSDLNIELLP